MNKTGYLIFEVCKTCNLGKLHEPCPNQHPERFRDVLADKTVPDSMIVDIAKRMHEVHGFRGRIGWHYYNEPLMAEKRVWRLMDAIDAVLPQARYTLWTNGTRWPQSPENLKRFEEVHLTDYRLEDYPVDRDAWRAMVPHVKVQHWGLDERTQNIELAPDKRHKPCRRMFTEFIVDYYGNVHLCCYDWRGLGSPGNVHTDSLDVLVAKWTSIRDSMIGDDMTAAAPNVCRLCWMRSAGITCFVQEAAEEAEQYVRAMK